MKYNYKSLQAFLNNLIIVSIFYFFTGVEIIKAQSKKFPEHSVEAELASFKVAEGYQVDLYASEDLGIAEPVTMRWDEEGRLWVLCTPTYPQVLPGEKPNDKLVILEDVNKDGKADISKIYADGLNMPLGFELGHKGVYLGHQTELVHLRDTNNDGIADTKQVLLTGFGNGDSHQTINSLIWSPGGELFFSQGLSIYSRVETAEGVKKADKGAIWRYRPLRSQLTSFVDASTASDNPWGMNFGDWGEMFIKGNDLTLYYGAPGLVDGPFRSELPDIGRLEIKGGIIELPRTKHLPDDLKNNFLIAGYYNNKIERFRFQEDGSGYNSKLIEPILVSSSRNFRPVDVKIGPDGAIYVLDWYNPVIGHYQASMRHPERDKTHGRVWRITYKNRPLVKPPQLKGQAVAQLLEHLRSDEFWVRYQVRRLLAESTLEEVKPSLETWIKNLNPLDNSYDQLLVEAMGVCLSHEWVNKELLDLLLKSKTHGAREFGAKAIGRWHERLSDPIQLLQPLIHDTHPRVRLEALVALSDIHTSEAMRVAVQVTDHPMDKFLRYALEKTVYALQPYWEPALKSGQQIFNTPAQQAWIISIMPPAWYTAEMYIQLIKAENLMPEIKRNLLLSLARIGKSEDYDFILSQPFVRNDVTLLNALNKLESKPVSPKGINSLKDILTNSKSSEMKIAIIRLAKNWKLEGLYDNMSAISKSKATPVNMRAEILEALVRINGKESLPLLKEIINSHDSPTALRIAALKSMSELDIDDAVKLTVGEMVKSGKSAKEMIVVLSPVLERQGGINALTTQLEKSKLPKLYAQFAIQAISSKGLNDPDLRNCLNKLAQTPTFVEREFNETYLNNLETYVKQKGDAIKGSFIYQSLPACAACHIINGKGGKIGPNLSAIGKGLSPREIIVEVLWPNNNVKEGFEMVVLETKNGEIIRGNKAFENDEAVFVKLPSSNEPIKLLKTNIARQTNKGSLMPTGLLNNTSEEDLRDLIRYLSELGTSNKEVSDTK